MVKVRGVDEHSDKQPVPEKGDDSMQKELAQDQVPETDPHAHIIGLLPPQGEDKAEEDGGPQGSLLGEMDKNSGLLLTESEDNRKRDDKYNSKHADKLRASQWCKLKDGSAYRVRPNEEGKLGDVKT